MTDEEAMEEIAAAMPNVIIQNGIFEMEEIEQTAYTPDSTIEPDLEIEEWQDAVQRMGGKSTQRRISVGSALIRTLCLESALPSCQKSKLPWRKMSTA